MGPAPQFHSLACLRRYCHRLHGWARLERTSAARVTSRSSMTARRRGVGVGAAETDPLLTTAVVSGSWHHPPPGHLHHRGHSDRLVHHHEMATKPRSERHQTDYPPRERMLRDHLRPQHPCDYQARQQSARQWAVPRHFRHHHPSAKAADLPAARPSMRPWCGAMSETHVAMAHHHLEAAGRQGFGPHARHSRRRLQTPSILG